MDKLPIDVLLNIFDDCDVADVLNLTLTCKWLRTATEERHVWLTQFKRHCAAFRQAPFRSRTKELHLHSTAQLRSWAIRQALTNALWVQNEDTSDNLKLQSVQINDPEGIRYSTTILLPGGEHLVVLTNANEIILKKIGRGNDIGGSEWVLTDIARCAPGGSEKVECSDDVFTDTICEYPLISYHDINNASVTIFHLDYDSGTISVQKRLQANTRGGARYYYMGHLGIRGDTILWLYGDFFHGYLEHLVVAKIDDPDGVATRHFDLDLGEPTIGVSRFEVLTANSFIRYDYYGIYLYHIPHLSPGTQSQDGNGEQPTPSIAWSSIDYYAYDRYGGFYYDRTDAVLPNFYLRDRHSHMIEFGTDTPTDTDRDPSVEYPVVLNHTVAPISWNPFRGSKGRKAAQFGIYSTVGEVHIDTMLIDNPNRRGHFCANLRQYGVLGVGAQRVKTMEYDEVTGRILLHFHEGQCRNRRAPGRLFLADLSRPRHEKSRNLPPGPLDFEKPRNRIRTKRIDNGRPE